MILRIEAYSDQGYQTLMKREIPSTTKNWERILRKMYNYCSKHCNQPYIDIFAVVIEEGYHEVSQAWAVEYMKHCPMNDLPFM